MKNHKTPALCALLLAALFAASCEWEPTPTDNLIFATKLRGTWESNDPSVYSGKLIIEYNRITISGYYENQTPIPGDDNQRPFKDFIKDFSLKGYSEEGDTDGEGFIFMEDGGVMQAGIPYTWWEGGYQSGYTRVQFLRFTFGDRPETLVKTVQ